VKLCSVQMRLIASEPNDDFGRSLPFRRRLQSKLGYNAVESFHADLRASSTLRSGGAEQRMHDTSFPKETEGSHLRRKSIPHPSYPFENAKHWRLRAEAMRTLAEEAIDSTVRAMMLRIAADYDRLAESANDRAAHDSIMFRTAESEA
jgi:hypothetical protein